MVLSSGSGSGKGARIVSGANLVRRDVVRAVRAEISIGRAEGSGVILVAWLMLWQYQGWDCV